MKTEYTDEFKAEALASLDANQGNLKGTARDLGIPQSTLRDWRDDKGVSTLTPRVRDQKRGELADRLEAIAYQLIDGMTPELMKKMSGVQRMTAFGIAFDKLRLLKGEATSIHEERQVEEIRSRLESKLFAATNGAA